MGRPRLGKPRLGQKLFRGVSLDDPFRILTAVLRDKP